MNLPAVLDRFTSIYVLDTEYHETSGLPGGAVVPVCLVAYEIRGSTWTEMFFSDPRAMYARPFERKALFITFNAAAEWHTFLSLQWDLPRYVIDLFVEFRNLVSGLVPPARLRNPRAPNKWDSSLLGVMRWCGVERRTHAEKDSARALVLRGHPYSPQEQQFILNYCRDDVTDTLAIAEQILPRVNKLPQAIFRAAFMRAISRIERAGIPVDVDLYQELITHRDALKRDIVEQLAGTGLDIYEGTTLRYLKLVGLIQRLGLESKWPHPKPTRKRKRAAVSPNRLKVFSTECDAFDSMAILYPELTPLASVVRQMSDMKTFALEIGFDHCARYPVFPFSTNTGRCAPPSKKFLFQQSAWTRSFIQPPPGWAVCYLDYSAAEVLIAAVLSGDRNLLRDYLEGDPYVNTAIRLRFAPPESTKASIGALRDTMKVWLLSCLYGASAQSLSNKLRGSTVEQAEQFIRENHKSYAKYWHWSNKRVEIFLYETHVEHTCFGWTHHLDPSEHDEPGFTFAGNRSRNFPMQATCSEILRFACTMITDDMITVHATVHDAVLVGAPEPMIEGAVERTKQHMIRASELVLKVPMRVGVGEIIRHPNRMMDPRGTAVWNQMLARLSKYRVSAAA